MNKTKDIEIIKEKALSTEVKVKPENVGLALAQASRAIKNVEDIGTAMTHTAQQYTMAIENILAKDYDFSDEMLKDLEGKLKVLLVTLGQFEERGFNILSLNDIKVVGEIAKTKYERLASSNDKKSLPLSTKEFNKFLGIESGKKKKEKK
jgi:hypothetical protein